MLHIFNGEWGMEHQGHASHHMLQTELMHRRRQEQQEQPAVSGRIIMGGIIVNSDPSVEQAAAAAVEAAEAAAHRVLGARHFGQDIICSGSSISGEAQGKIIHHSLPCLHKTDPFSLDELKTKYKRASETARRWASRTILHTSNVVLH